MWAQEASRVKANTISPAPVAVDVPVLGVGVLSSVTAKGEPPLTETVCVVHLAVVAVRYR
jgi:hypothetical protein